MYVNKNIRQSTSSKTYRFQSDFTLAFQSLTVLCVSVKVILNIVNPLPYLGPQDSFIQKKQREMEEVIYFHKLKIA